MSEKFNGCHVAFCEPLSEDHVELILNAIRMIRGVAEVTANECESSFNDFAIRQQVKLEFQKEFAAIHDRVFGLRGTK